MAAVKGQSKILCGNPGHITPSALFAKLDFGATDHRIDSRDDEPCCPEQRGGLGILLSTPEIFTPTA
jgi:hypothetical protein